MEIIPPIRSIDDRRALLRSTSPTRKARKRDYLIDFTGESVGTVLVGGGGGIRTHGDLSATPVFKTGAFNRSATPPRYSPADVPQSSR
jgi:hypothetical protein